MGRLGETDIATYSYTPLFAGTAQVILSDVSETVITGSGVVLEGTVMGRITASGKITPLDKDAVDGSQVPVGVFATDTVDHQVDATSADKVGSLYLSGQFNSDALYFASGTVLADVKQAMIAANLYPSTAVGTDGIWP